MVRFYEFKLDDNINLAEERKNIFKYIGEQPIPVDFFDKISDISFSSEQLLLCNLVEQIDCYYNGSSSWNIEKPFTDYREEWDYNRQRYITKPFTNYYSELISNPINGNYKQQISELFIFPFNINCYCLDRLNIELKSIKNWQELDFKTKDLILTEVLNGSEHCEKWKNKINGNTKKIIDKDITGFSGELGFNITDFSGIVVKFESFITKFKYNDTEYEAQFCYFNNKIFKAQNIILPQKKSNGSIIYENNNSNAKNRLEEMELKEDSLKKEIDNKKAEILYLNDEISSMEKSIINIFSKKAIGNLIKTVNQYNNELKNLEDELNKTTIDRITFKSKSKKEEAQLIEKYCKNYKEIKEKSLGAFLSENEYLFNDKKAKRFTDIDTNSKKLQKYVENLNELVGLCKVKEEVRSLINLINLNIMREKKGLSTTPMSYHLVFTGNPGTGKTTVARLLAKIYNALGIISSDNLVEVDRSDLVAGYVGQTAIKTAEIINKAMGGVLFIDEAYSLEKNDDNDFGQEAIDTLLKAMEDNRDNLVVIVAGYTNLMKNFIDSNPGLKSRFNRYIEFEDYSPKELVNILLLYCKKEGYTLSNDALEFAKQYFENRCKNKSENYANARDVRNFFEKGIVNLSNKLAQKNNLDLSKDELMTITIEDVEKIYIN